MNLYQHQIDGLKISAGKTHVAYFWDMGCGKTHVGSEKMKELDAPINLVVCQKSKVIDWMEHFRSNYKCHCLDLTTKTGMTAFCEYIKCNNCLPIIGVINYDLLWRRKELLELEHFTLLLDESSLIQHDNTNRTKFILDMKPDNVILLSGTPVGGKLENLWTQLHILGWNISKDLFLKQYTITEYVDLDTRTIPKVVGYKNVDRLKRKMREYGCQFLKTDEVFDLPDQIFQKTKVESSKWYQKFRKDKIVEFQWEGEIENACNPFDNGDTELVGDTTLTRMLYERQLCGMYSEAKLEAFEDLIESSKDRFIVFYNFTLELEEMMRICDNNDRPYSIINGKTKDLVAYEQHDDSITFVQYQAGAMGLNLQKAFRMIFFTLPLSSELFEQAKKRIHRIGQKQHCFYYIMLCKGSIDERILETLEMRQDFTEKLFEKGDDF